MSKKQTLALLLPGYSPDLAWINRALNADDVILDDLHPFSRKSRVHRTKIRTPEGHQWLTIPFVGEDRRRPIRNVRIDDRRPWLKHHLRALEYNYRNSIYFDFYEPEIRADLETAAEFELLVDAVRHLMKRQWTYLQLRNFPKWMSDSENDDFGQYEEMKKPVAASEQPGYEKIDDRIRQLTGSPQTGPVAIYQEPDSRNYQKPHPSAIDPPFSLPAYRQHFPGFEPGCGVLDLLFEYGPDSWQILDKLNPEK